MPFRLPAARWAATLAFAAALAGPALAQPRAARPDAAACIARATERLALTSDQQQQLAAVAARYPTPEPGAAPSDAGASWRLAADVARVLTPAQTAQLQERAGARRTGSRPAGRCGDHARDGRSDATPMTDAQPNGRRNRQVGEASQRDALRAAHEAFRPEMEALVERFQSGALDAAAFTAERDRLHAARRARVEALLTPEQREAHTVREARHTAERQARVEALGLTPAQQQALETLALERLRTAPARRAQDGDRDSAHDALRARADAVLTPEQRAIVVVHRALAAPTFRSGGDRTHRRRGESGREDARGRSSRTEDR